MDSNIIKDIYENMEMGIIGIDEVLYKVENKSLLKEMKGLKKEYQKILTYCQKYLEDHGESIPELSMMAKMSTEFMSQMKLMKDNCDATILDMMLKGTNKSLAILSSKKLNYDALNIMALKIISNTFSLLTRSQNNLYKLAKKII